jgi:hypothetical protein
MKETQTKKYKLTRHHELSKKFEDLCVLAEELGIRIYFSSAYTIVDYEGTEYELREVDNNSFIDEFPPVFEYKFVFEKEIADENST